MGDGAALVHRYASARGRPVDLDAIAYHTVCLLALATIGPMIALVEEHPGGDFIEALSQIGFIGRRTLEAMAEIEDVVLDDVRLPRARRAGPRSPRPPRRTRPRDNGNPTGCASLPADRRRRA